MTLRLLELSDGYALSGTNIYVLIDNKISNKIGATQKLEIKEERPVNLSNKKMPKLGRKNVSGTAYRVRIDRTRAQSLFTRGQPHVAAQRQPINILIVNDLTDKKTEKEYKLRTVIENCWITKMPSTYTAEDFIILEEMSFDAELLKTTWPPLTADDEMIKDIIE